MRAHNHELFSLPHLRALPKPGCCAAALLRGALGPISNLVHQSAFQNSLQSPLIIGKLLALSSSKAQEDDAHLEPGSGHH